MVFSVRAFPNNFLDYFSRHNFILLTPIISSTQDVTLLCVCGTTFTKNILTIRVDINQAKNICLACRRLANLRQVTSKKQGNVISTKYVDNTTPLLFKCHVTSHPPWEAPPARIINGGWCKQCANATAKIANTNPSIKNEMCSIATLRGGKLLSYLNSFTSATWECAEGHEWQALPSNIRKGTWCPHCGSGLYEQICRSHFEQLFKKQFPKRKPSWLKSELGGRLELDGYCEELGLAFEHQGKQHFEEVPCFTGCTLDRRLFLDSLKKKQCKDQGVHLIEIPVLGEQILIKDLKEFILLKCNLLGVACDPGVSIDFKKCYQYRKPASLISLLRSLSDNNGTLLSEYISREDPIKIKCNVCENIWETTPHSIEKGTWCPRCSIDNRRLASKKASEFVNKFNIRSISSIENANNRSAIAWQCSICLHQFTTSVRNIEKRSYGCPKCLI